MPRLFCILLFGLGLLGPLQAAPTAALIPLRVLYVGDRPERYVPFLQEHFAGVESLPLTKEAPKPTEPCQVVLLDWPDTKGLRERPLDISPLGRREDWRHPTVLLGSSGLNLAVSWRLKGGSGCTCLAPVAYDMRPHEIFAGPVPVDIQATTTIPTPPTFRHELKDPTIRVIPLVDTLGGSYVDVINRYPRGWCSYYYEFADVPEVEFFCGGINEKTPRAAAFWRQGNLLHFGFNQAPAEMNAFGRALLINAIAYISRFSVDRPIDITPSVFARDKIGISRRRARNLLTSPNYRPEWLGTEFAASTLARFDVQKSSSAAAWAETNVAWLHPAANNLLEIDEEARRLDLPFDAPDFIPRAIAALRVEKTARDAAVLLQRYVNAGPGSDAGADAWAEWWQTNAPFLFFSELGRYRWYLDPLAKARGIPTRDLRGPARADLSR